jgi:hypothetical protein
VEKFAGDMNANTSLLLPEGAGRPEILESKSTKLPDPLSRADAIASSLKVAVGGALPNSSLKTISLV